MALFNKEGLLVTKKGKYQVDDLVSKLTFVSGDYLVTFLQSIGLSVPRKMRMKVLSEVLKDPVAKTIKERKSLADEMGYRLTWFSKFTDTQLVNLLEWYKSTSLGNLYLSGFWKELLNYMVNKGVGDDDLERMFNAATAAEKAGKRPATGKFNDEINVVLYDEEGEIDGVTQEQFRPVVYKATTLTELRAIGKKYNAPIPKRLKKSEMLDIILGKLKERDELTPQLESKLKSQNIILLERFAKDHDIKVSTELKKEEIIEFILSNAEETKSSYFVPQSQGVYEDIDEPVEAPVKVEAPKPEPKPEPETKPEPIVVEKVVENTPKVVLNAEPIDYRPQLEKLAEAFETLAQNFDKKEFVIKVENQNVMPQVEKAPEAPVQDVLQPQVVQTQKQTPANMMVDQEILIQELLKDDDVESLDLDEEIMADRTPAKKFYYKKKLGVTASFFALLSAAAFAWLALLSLDYLIAPFLIEANQMVDNLNDMQHNILTYGSIGFAALNLLMFLRLLMRPKKAELIVMGILSLFSGFVITGLLVFGSIRHRAIEVKEEPKNDTEKLAEAISNLNTTGKGKKVKKSGFFLKFMFTLVTISLILVLVLYGMWRLDFTYGYENIPVFGPFVRDYIIEPLFGSAHDLSRY